MKYLKKFKVFESHENKSEIIMDLEDIFLEIKDDGIFDYKVYSSDEWDNSYLNFGGVSKYLIMLKLSNSDDYDDYEYYDNDENYQVITPNVIECIERGSRYLGMDCIMYIGDNDDEDGESFTIDDLKKELTYTDINRRHLMIGSSYIKIIYYE